MGMPRSERGSSPTVVSPSDKSICCSVNSQVTAVFGKDPRAYGLMTTEFVGDADGNVIAAKTIDVELKDGVIKPIEGSERTFETDLVIIAMGWVVGRRSVIDGCVVPTETIDTLLSVVLQVPVSGADDRLETRPRCRPTQQYPCGVSPPPPPPCGWQCLWRPLPTILAHNKPVRDAVLEVLGLPHVPRGSLRCR